MSLRTDPSLLSYMSLERQIHHAGNFANNSEDWINIYDGTLNALGGGTISYDFVNDGFGARETVKLNGDWEIEGSFMYFWSGGGGLAFLVQDFDSGYLLEANSSTLTLYSRNNSGTWTSLGSGAASFFAFVPYTLKVQKTGSTFRCFANGSFVFEVSSTTFTTGYIGVGTRTDAQSIYITNTKVNCTQIDEYGYLNHHTNTTDSYRPYTVANVHWNDPKGFRSGALFTGSSGVTLDATYGAGGDASHPVTVNFWVNIANADISNTRYALSASGGFAVILPNGGTGNLAWQWGGTTAGTNGGALYITNFLSGYADKWVMVTLTSDGVNGGTMKIYRNGTVASSAVHARKLSTQFTSYEIGLVALYFKGYMSDLGIWKRVLTPYEIKSLYRQTYRKA